MHPTTLELMIDQVRAIYRALTGEELPEGVAAPGAPIPSAGTAPTAGALLPEVVARHFADLEAMARAIPRVAERVPPFSFAPPLDAIDDTRELIIEVAVPGVDRRDVVVERTGDLLTVSGVRPGERASNGRTYVHAEIARGPFHRVVQLPYPTVGDPRVEIDRGIVRIRLSKASIAPAAKA